MPTLIDLEDYALQKTEGSLCNDCGTRLFMLYPRRPIDGNRFFYLCDMCGGVTEAGEGPVVKAVVEKPPEKSST